MTNTMPEQPTYTAESNAAAFDPNEQAFDSFLGDAPEVTLGNPEDVNGDFDLYTFLDLHLSGPSLITGLPGSGKTTALITSDKPSREVMMDLDRKSEALCKQLGIVYFKPQGEGLEDPENYSMSAVHDWAMRTFREIGEYPAQGRTTLLIDNIAMLEDAFETAVIADPKKYNVRPGNIEKNSYGGANPGISRAWINVISYLQGKGFTRIMLSTHMNNVWVNNAPVEKWRALGNKELTKLSNLSVVLIRSNRPNRPPVGIVGKEALGMLRWDEAKQDYKTSMALPPRVPEFTWRNVAKFISLFQADAIKDFAPDQIPTQEEMERYGPWFSTEQKKLILTVAANPAFQIGEEAGPAPTSTVVNNAPAPQTQTKPAYQPPSPTTSDNPTTWAELWAKCNTLFGVTREAAGAELRKKFSGTPAVEQIPVYWAYLKNVYKKE